MIGSSGSDEAVVCQLIVVRLSRYIEYLTVEGHV